MVRAPLALALVTTALAGCLAEEGPLRGEVGEELLRGLPLDDILVNDHNHTDLALHEGARNVALVGFNNGADGAPLAPGTAYGELAVKDGFVYVVRGGPEPGFVIVDAHDPANPTVSAEFAAEYGGITGDIEVSDDGNWVFLSAQRNYPGNWWEAPRNAQDPQRAANFLMDIAAGPQDDLPRGTYVVNVEDKAAPRLESFFPLPTNGPHTITYYRHGERDLVLHATYDILFTTYPEDMGQLQPTQKVVITELVEEAGRRVLRPLSQFQRLDAQPAEKLYFPHDTSVQVHPVTGQTLLYVSYWDLGVFLVDITEPGSPRLVGEHHDFEPSPYGQIHYTGASPEYVCADGPRAFEDTSPRESCLHLTVAEPEIPGGMETGQITFLDTTDPASPRKLGHWKLPAEVAVDAPFVFSPHNFDVSNGLVALAHIHAGLWVLDVGTPAKASSPEAVGYYFPTQPNEAWVAPPTIAYRPMVPSAYWHEGLIYTVDAASGLYILDYTGDGSPTTTA